MMNRRKFLKLSSGSAGSLILPSCSAQSLSISSSDLPDLNKQPLGSSFGLATSLREEFTYNPKVNGKIPTELQGTIYRNGPGLFDRNGSRKLSLLDGDGMVWCKPITFEKVE
jgi:all-trans-8'-apo-beta-carotenal 15,15'-oxygenase